MLVYLAVFLIPLLCSFLRPRTGLRRDVGLFAYFLLLLIFTGLRDHVGADWSGYLNIYDHDSAATLSDIFSDREFGFGLINKLSQFFGAGLYGVNLICASIFLSGVFLYARKTSNAWLAIAAVTPFLIFIISMSGIRQSAAIGIGLILFSRWERSSLLYKLAMIALATSIHNSAIFLLVFVLIQFDRYLWLRVMAATAIALLSLRGVADTAAFARYSHVYVQNDLQSGGAFFHVMLSAFPAMLYLLLRRRLNVHGGRNQLVDVGAWAVLLMMPLILVSSTGMSRLSLYLSFLQMWIYPALVALPGRGRQPKTLLFAALFLTIFLVYFLLGTFVYTYLPYRSVLFD